MRLSGTDIIRTPWKLRCAQTPYDTLPIPRVQVPPGIILSREANTWIKEDSIEDVALPLYEGRMIGQFDFSQKGWVSGKGRTAVWQDVDWTSKRIEPQYLLKLNIWFYQALSTYFKSFGAAHGKDQAEAEKVRLTDPEQFALWWWARRRKVAFIDVTSATNTRTMFSTALAELPCGNSAPILTCNSTTLLPAILNSLVYDTVARFRCGGVHLNWFVIEESTLPPFCGIKGSPLAAISLALSFSIERMAEFWIELGLEPNIPWRNLWALSDAERLRLRCALDAAVSC